MPYGRVDGHAGSDAAANKIAAAILAFFIPRFRQTACALGRHASHVSHRGACLCTLHVRIHKSKKLQVISCQVIIFYNAEGFSRG